jgi:hypothetical protein
MSDTYEHPSGIGSTTASCAACEDTIGHNGLVCLGCSDKFLKVKRTVEKELGLDHGCLTMGEVNRINTAVVKHFREKCGS